MRSPSPTTAELVSLAQSGDVRAAEGLVQRHLSLVRGLAYRLLGQRSELDDVVQETFARAFDGLGSLENPESFGTWLGQITINVSRQAIHQQIRGRRAATVDSIDVMASSDAPAEARMELQAIYRALIGMPEQLRVAFVLRRVEGMPLAEIATAMGASLASVKRWVTKAERRLEQETEITRGAEPVFSNDRAAEG